METPSLPSLYFSGIGGVGIGPLAAIAADAGYPVAGSDLRASPMTEQLVAKGVQVAIGQDGSQIAAQHAVRPIDWFVHTAALPADHPELTFCREHGIKTSKRDDLLASIIQQKNLRLIAVSGTHGKTTTTGMLVWAFQCLGVPLSYSVGSTLPFGPSGAYNPASEYFVYECDEFDRNMLHFWPWLSLIPSLDYDHADTYPTQAEYQAAFIDFIGQSNETLLWEQAARSLTDNERDLSYEAYDEQRDLSHLHLAGDHNRHNAYLVERACYIIFPEKSHGDIVAALNSFPGTGRRFERLAPALYSDYAHHPAEIAATLQLASELSDKVVVVYQPHQNIRQHELKSQYTDCFARAAQVYWLPTYLSRENPGLPVLSPAELMSGLTNRKNAHEAQLDDALWKNIQQARADGYLVVLLSAGDGDAWLRGRLADSAQTDLPSAT